MTSLLSTHEPSVHELSVREPSVTPTGLLPPVAENKIQCWIRSRHVICSGNFFVFETVDYSAVERFTDCIMTLGGSVISVDSVGKIWIGNHRQVILYRVKASLHTPHHDLKQYWFKYGSLRTRFDPQI
jgi:phycoerythrin-associated linker protein